MLSLERPLIEFERSRARFKSEKMDGSRLTVREDRPVRLGAVVVRRQSDVARVVALVRHFQGFDAQPENNPNTLTS